ncbi:MAG: hypothetical protein J6I84_04495 [Bacilli bacterium]|nr:hypothetical protein [Bacilli bacterium]
MRGMIITHEAFRYIEANKSRFSISTKPGDLWEVTDIRSYPGVLHGEEVVEAKRDSEWIRIPSALVKVINIGNKYADLRKRKGNQGNDLCS